MDSADTRGEFRMTFLNGLLIFLLTVVVIGVLARLISRFVPGIESFGVGC